MAVMATSKKKSPIWDYFTIDDDQTHIAICKECRHKVSQFILHHSSHGPGYMITGCSVHNQRIERL